MTVAIGAVVSLPLGTNANGNMATMRATVSHGSMGRAYNGVSQVVCGPISVSLTKSPDNGIY